jgi:hypothetical protein
MSQRQKQLVEAFNTLSQDRIQLENNILQFLDQDIIVKLFNLGKNILVLNFQHLILRQGNFKLPIFGQDKSKHLNLRQGNFKHPILGQDRSKHFNLTKQGPTT